MAVPCGIGEKPTVNAGQLEEEVDNKRDELREEEKDAKTYG